MLSSPSLISKRKFSKMGTIGLLGITPLTEDSFLRSAEVEMMNFMDQ
jgi:hypothetical protein